MLDPYSNVKSDSTVKLINSLPDPSGPIRGKTIDAIIFDDAQEFDPAADETTGNDFSGDAGFLKDVDRIIKGANETDAEAKAYTILAIKSSIDRSAALRDLKESDPENYEAVKAKFEEIRNQSEKK